MVLGLQLMDHALELRLKVRSEISVVLMLFNKSQLLQNLFILFILPLKTMLDIVLKILKYLTA